MESEYGGNSIESSNLSLSAIALNAANRGFYFWLDQAVYNVHMSLIELKNVSKHFHAGETKTMALDEINISIEPGEFVAIMGPSGSGKSSLMNILGLLDTPSGGEYWLDGQDVSSKNDTDLARLRSQNIGFVFQSFNLLPRLSILQNVVLPMVYGGTPSGKRKARALELLDLVGIQDRAHHRPNQVSGGQAQRAAIARALANDPSLLLADEPTGNLDTKSSDAVISLLKDLHAKGNTILIVTHNPEIAAQAERTILIRDGKVVSDGASSSHSAVVARGAVAKKTTKRGSLSI